MLAMAGLAFSVVIAVVYRHSGSSLDWYDEMTAIMLAWLTYYGAALAALRRAHLGFRSRYEASSHAGRVAILIVSETFLIGFFLVIAWYSWDVVVIVTGDALTGLPRLPALLAQSVIPIGFVVIALAELLTIPERWREIQAPARAEQQEGSPP